MKGLYITLTSCLFSALSASATDYFYVEAIEANDTVQMISEYGAPSVNLLYSTDGATWNTFTVDETEVVLAAPGDKVWFKAGGSGNRQFAVDPIDDFVLVGSNAFSFSGNSKVGGDITTLLTAEGGVTDLSQYGTYTFYELFTSEATLTDASALILPSTTLTDYCYGDMFNGCSNLTAAPKLPATTLANNCYDGMFCFCKSLTAAPELPATTLAKNCYSSMFMRCSSLNSVKVAFTDWNSDGESTKEWMSGVPSTGTFTCPSTLSQTTGISYIPEGWTVETSEATGIKNAKVADTDDAAWYTLDGYKLPTTPKQKGVYVHENKKVMVK